MTDRCECFTSGLTASAGSALRSPRALPQKSKKKAGTSGFGSLKIRSGWLRTAGSKQLNAQDETKRLAPDLKGLCWNLRHLDSTSHPPHHQSPKPTGLSK